MSDRKKIIIWDFDGVIVDSIGYKYDGIWADVFEGEEERRQSVLTFLNTEEGKSVNRYGLIAHALGVSGSDEEIKEHPEVVKYAKRYRDAAISGVIKIGMFDGAKEVLEKLLESGHSMYIVSGGGSDEDLKEVTEKLRIDQYFKGIFGFGETHMPLVSFGKWENYERLSKIEGVDHPKQYVVIGDGDSDYKLAQDIDCDFIAIPTEWNNWEEDKGMKKMLVASIREVPKKIEELESLN